MFFVKEVQKRIKNEKGLTLVELLAVIVILAIIAAIAIPAIGNIIDNSRYKAVKSDAINVLNSAQIYFTDKAGEESVTVATLVSEGYLENAGKIPNTTASTIAKVAGGNELTTAVIDYDGQNDTKFTGATIIEINAHDDKTDDVIGD